MTRPFTKMHGAGNDFVLIDLRAGGQSPPDARLAQAIGDRHRGVGFDQLLAIEPSARADCVARYSIWNQDGSQARQCGNGARCVAAWLVRDGSVQGSRFRLDSPAGVIEVESLGDDRYALDMGLPEFDPARIPFDAPDGSKPEYSLTLPDGEQRFGAASMGNPHALIRVDDLAQARVAELGAAMQQSGAFADGVNVGFAQILARDAIALRVYERGAGETLACGSGACAAVAILVRQGLVDRRVRVDLPGGTLEIDWPDDTAPVRMSGPTTFVFDGEWLQ